MTEPMPPDERFMRRALELADAGRPSPNPRVGAVIVKGDQIIAEGFHAHAGGPHAEIAALEKAAGDAAGATLYVTLEPCNHVGRTPPCTKAILAAKIARVVIGCSDPNPHVEGGGADVLRKAGIDVEAGVCETEAKALIAPWTKHVTTGLPHVVLKLALSLDGRIATRTGSSKWVTGRDARARVHALRANADAVAVGINTALADDPRLTVRAAEGEDPIRIVFDTRLRLPTHLRLVTTAREVPTWVLTSVDAETGPEEELTSRGVEVIRVPVGAEGRIDVHTAARTLAERGIVSLLVEGGAELAGSLLATRLADELHAFLAPILLGPRARAAAVDWAGPDEPQQAPRIISPNWEVCGEDAHVWGRIKYPDPPAAP
ncbi:bifunctional diaminohydroxyphosphoribosylaminopyrimidine deaminase/5-amino-6-(5-phosphoribosylamino)uracil reductase RibD [soil metagenome]